VSLPALPAISVAVPNYNYARHLPERLGSIFSQAQPVREVLVLDDCSRDDSLDVIPLVAKDWRRKIRLLPNKTNSGSVFKQWRKAAEESIGDYLWIAEADDLSDPRFLSEIIALMCHDDSISMGFSDSSAIDDDGVTIWPSYSGYYATVAPGALSKTEIFDSDVFAAKYLSVKNLILNVSSVVWRRKALLDAMDACEKDLKTFKMAGDWRLYLQALSVAGTRVAYCAHAYNVHRRHAASVTHTLDGERHVAEIAACHKFARTAFVLSTETQKSQERYLVEVGEQLVAARKSDGGPKQSASRGSGVSRRNSVIQPTST